MKSNVDLYLNADKTKVVAEGDPDAAFLLVNAGREVPDAEISSQGEGLLSQARQLGKAEADEAEADEAEAKQVAAPPENKAVTTSETKSK